MKQHIVRPSQGVEYRHPAPKLTVEDLATRQDVKPRAKVGRNEPCPCGSKKKFKRCHGRPQ